MATQQTTSSESRLFNSEERMSVAVGDKQFVCIEYPGIVQNVDKALQTLGGWKVISKSIDDPKSRLPLRHRPDDLYSKPAYGTCNKTAGLVIRVRRRKKKPQGDAQESVSPSGSHGDADSSQQGDGYEYKVDILGTVSSAIKFEGLCEFQYLPVAKKEDGSYKSLLDTLQLKTLISEDEYLARDGPLFIPPLVFSRFDYPQKYGYVIDRAVTPRETSLEPTDRLAPGRKTRSRYTTLIAFTDPTPTEPKEVTRKHAETFKKSGLQEGLEKLFEKRPIWSKAAIRYHMRDNIHTERYLKEILAAIAYMFLTGPWRTFWIRFGYDPRKDPAAKRYQGIDFRRRQKGLTEDLKIAAKRSMQKPSLPNKYLGISAEINLSLLRGEEAEDSNEPKLRDFEFHPDVLPPHRQVVYMVSDIYDDVIQDLVARNDGKETTCNERDGWCIQGFTHLSRNIMTEHMDKLCPESGAFRKLMRKKSAKRNDILDDSDDNEGNNSMDASGYD